MPAGLPLTPSPALPWRLLTQLWLLLLLLPWQVHAQAQGLRLDPSASRIEAWPVLQIADEGPVPLPLAQALALPFAKPQGARASLGLRKQAVWLRLPLQAPLAGDDGAWVLDIAYPVLQQVDIHLLIDGQPALTARLGSQVPVAERPLASRTHALPLQLPAGRAAVLLIRVQSEGALTLPIALSKPAAFHREAQRELLLQGLLNGVGLALLAYSLVKALVLRQTFFAKYALMISGSLLFSLLQFGIGAQYLWPDWPWMEHHAGGIAALLAACGSFLFIEQALREGASQRFTRLMQGGALLCMALLPVYALDLIDTHRITALISVLGLAPAALGLPGAWRRMRSGDAVGLTLLLAWGVYLLSTAVAIAVIKGQLDATAWTLHAFQIGATFDMLMFMRVLSLRQAAVQAAAWRDRQERDALHRMAHSDALTGLANRRGMQAALQRALDECPPGRMVAVFLLDLNGFKQVNDSHGHNIGDALLVAIAKRLQAKLPASDTLARLGGDEFVVISPGLAERSQAQAVGERLLDAFATPFRLGALNVEVGVALGQALAPQDGQDPTLLLQTADAAMYRGKPGLNTIPSASPRGQRPRQR